MKIQKISVLVSKKLGKDFNSYSVSLGATAELQGEDWREATRALEQSLKELCNEGLQTPKQKGKLICLSR